jgi:hypothetical protein
MSQEKTSVVLASESDFGDAAIKEQNAAPALPEKYRGLKNKSEVMVAMFKDGQDVKDIFKILKKCGLVKHYQHVRNTLINKGYITSSKARS